MKAKPRRRQIFVLTPEEKKIVACICAALALGLATKHYRAAHPRPAPPPTVQEQRAAKLALRTAAAQDRSMRTAKAAARPTSASIENKDDGDDE